MLFKIVSFHPSTDGSVKPKRPTFIEAVTVANAKFVAAEHLSVPEEQLTLDAYEGDIPGGAVLLDDRVLRRSPRLSNTHAFL